MQNLLTSGADPNGRTCLGEVIKITRFEFRLINIIIFF